MVIVARFDRFAGSTRHLILDPAVRGVSIHGCGLHQPKREYRHLYSLGKMVFTVLGCSTTNRSMIDCSITPPGRDYWPSVIHHSSPCRHVTASTTPAEMIRSTFRTKILLPKTPYFFSRCTQTFPDGVCEVCSQQRRCLQPYTLGSTGSLTHAIWHGSCRCWSRCASRTNPSIHVFV